MIIAEAESGAKKVLLLGLSLQNLEKLMNGQPMHISREKHGAAIPENLIIGIFYGPTEQHMADDLRRLGAITENTAIKEQPKNAD